MPRTKELSEELRKRIVDAHEAGKGYKFISKEFGLHRSTVRQIVYKWRIFKTTVTLPRSGRPTKITQEQGVYDHKGPQGNTTSMLANVQVH